MNIINEFFVSFILIKLYFKFKVCRKIKFPLLWKFYFSKWKFYFSADKRAIEQSYLGQFGKGIEPIFKPLELDWKLSVSLISGLAAKEVMISTMGVLYSLGKDVDETNNDLKGIIAKNIPLPSAVAYILFVMIYNPCFAATIVFSKESGKIKYTFFLFLFTCISAYIVAFIGLNITKFVIN